MIKRIKTVYLNADDGKKTEESLALEVLISNKGQPDFKSKESFGIVKTVNEDSGKLEMYPFVAIYTNNVLLADFGDAFSDYSKEQLETPTKPKFIRYFHVEVKNFDPKVGKQVIMMFGGEKHPYEITRVEDYA
jgi:hypothetical protein